MSEISLNICIFSRFALENIIIVFTNKSIQHQQLNYCHFSSLFIALQQ